MAQSEIIPGADYQLLPQTDAQGVEYFEVLLGEVKEGPFATREEAINFAMGKYKEVP